MAAIDNGRHIRRCTTPACPSTGATMACPSCVKLKQREPLGFEDSPGVDFYCTQECFKSHWAEHKKKHRPWGALIDEWEKAHPVALEKRMPEAFNGYGDWTGSLRPFARGPAARARLESLPSSIARPDYWKTGQPVSEQQEKRTHGIKVYSEREIGLIREACRVGREVLDECGRAARVGVTTAEIDRVCYEATVERGAYPSPLNYYNFPCSVCTSVNEVVCHGIPDMRELEDGDILNIDVSVFKDGVHGDLNETYFIGTPDIDSLRLVKTAFECLEAGAAIIKPGTWYRDVGAAISRVARANACSVVRTYCGHGIGDLFHTAPNVPHYAKNKATGIMKPGHVFTIEPMINLGTYRDRTWPDQWTAVTVDGKRSAQFEHTFLVTEDGYEILTMRQNEPTMLWDLKKQLRL
ncbi:hypothetical protein CTAYLR_007958 [Chrysophaeum taylorii]|uniref:Methionine aminopeptidase n=1 Tax=Chrysophaeum taylorii TaxID=2483200 RepID=A0AAD7UAY9_9STRA|nr:hypothetical protein CTAYLR_007958 [Chrysophaeum taylorii]